MATASDAATLARLLHDFNEEFDARTDTEPVLAERFGRILADPDVLALVATAAGRAAGFALVTLRPAIWFDGPVATLDELYVVPADRDRGIGTALLIRARDELLRRGCPEMQINVDEVDSAARRFYERHGFVNAEDGAEGRMLCYVGPTRPGMPAPGNRLEAS